MRRLVLIVVMLSGCVGYGACSSTAPSSTSATCTLSGQVTESVIGTGVSAASVTIVDGVNAGKGATTDASGAYRVCGLQQSGFTVTVSASNYVAQSKAVTLTSDQTVPFQLVRSVFNFQGVWAGSWVQQSCSETGSAVGFCARSNGAIVLGLTQSGTTAQGTLDGLGNQMTVSGPIGTTGTLTLTGQGTTPAGGPVTLRNWQSQLSGNSMTGSFTWVVMSAPNTAAGTATVIATFEHLPRVG